MNNFKFIGDRFYWVLSNNILTSNFGLSVKKLFELIKVPANPVKRYIQNRNLCNRKNTKKIVN